MLRSNEPIVLPLYKGELEGVLLAFSLYYNQLSKTRAPLPASPYKGEELKARYASPGDITQ
jgi:hypothetical protein